MRFCNQLAIDKSSVFSELSGVQLTRYKLMLIPVEILVELPFPTKG